MLEKTGFVSYFLIVWDFIHFAKQRGIPVGPGRGSAAGSMVAYVLGITDVDPLQFDLLFERFLNPERVSPPDIDVDFCEARRAEVIEYVRQKYGERRVSQIITFGTLGEERGARRRPRDRAELWRRRPDRQDDPERTEHHARGCGGEDARFEEGDRDRAGHATALGLRARARRPVAQRRRARRRRRHRRSRSGRIRAAQPRQQRNGRRSASLPWVRSPTSAC